MDLRTEWLEADGRGGFASGTVGLLRTRRYHALLLASATPPTGRFVLVNGIEAWAVTAAGRTALTAQAYADGTIFPDGRAHLRDFQATPFPSWMFALPDGTALTFAIFCARDEAETVLRWTANRPVDLAVRPLFSGRDYHALHHQNHAFAFGSVTTEAGRTWHPYDGIPPISARGDFGWTDQPVWYRGFSYARERERGLDDGEDLASPGLFTWKSVRQATLAFRAGPPGSRPLDAVEGAERARRSRPARDVAADAYLAIRCDGRTVLAGFPWFTDWGRDTFVAMRGLLIARGRLREAAAVLLAWSGLVSEGMLPNRFPDAGEQPEYNAVDASLWFAVAVHELLAAGGLPFEVVTPELRAGIVALAERELLTPLGLRTLSPSDPDYRPRYAGGPAERDGAYHQGTAWPWLLGPFVAAWLAVRGDRPGSLTTARAEARARFLAPLREHLHAAGLGHVSEVADGDPPHHPGGCPFQAWSLGELIRIETMLGDEVRPGGAPA